MNRFEILDTANEIVGGHRVTEYGEPEDNFGIIARLWSDYLGIDIRPRDVAMLMVLFKAGRIKSGTATEDSFVDICGYAACGGEIAAKTDISKRKESEKPESYDILCKDWGQAVDILNRTNKYIKDHGGVSEEVLYEVITADDACMPSISPSYECRRKTGWTSEITANIEVVGSNVRLRLLAPEYHSEWD